MLDEQTICDLAYATQDAIIDVLVTKTLKAAEKYDVKTILLGGGVAANQTLIAECEQKFDADFFVPEKNLCTDNAAMIATAAFFHNQTVPWQKITADPELYFE